jgi:undecaprenyl-diphosphatase
MSSPSSGLRVSQAVALGALHGSAELLPVSSSGHIAVVPWLLGWDYGELDDDLRKAFEVALHAGTAAALLVSLRAEIGNAVRDLGPRLIALVGPASLPPALAGLLLGRPIERHLGTPGTVAAGLFTGGLAMAWADRTPQARPSEDAGPADALWLGAAQACALFPGVSRSGATLAAARWRGFSRDAANRLSRHVVLPVLAGAAALKGWQLRRHGLPAGLAAPFAAGTVAAFASTLCFGPVVQTLERDRSLTPYALYRMGLALAIFRRLTEPATTMTR